MADGILSSNVLWGFVDPHLNNGHGSELRNCLRYASVAHIFVLYGTREQLKMAREYLDKAKGYINFTGRNAGINEVDDYLGAVEAELVTREQLGR